MTKRILAIAAIFLGTTAAWCILGSALFLRTESTTSSLSGRVASTWGDTQEQTQPDIHYLIQHTETVTSEENGKKITRQENRVTPQPVAVDSSKIRADFHVDYRQKGLLWFSTYQVAFQGEHAFHNPTANDQTFEFRLSLPAQRAVYDGLGALSGRQTAALDVWCIGCFREAVIPAGASGVLKATYRSQGQKSWRYRLAQAATGNAVPREAADVSEASDFHMIMRTDFAGFDFPDNSLSPTAKQQLGKGWELRWDYQNLVSGFDIALVMPEKLQPGPLAARNQLFCARVSLFLLLSGVHSFNAARDRPAPDELFLSGCCVFFISPVAGLFGGPHLDSLGVCDFLRRVNVACGHLPEIGSEFAICVVGCRAGATRLPGFVFVCVLLSGLHRSSDNHRSDLVAICRHANDRTNSLGGKVCPARSRRLACAREGIGILVVSFLNPAYSVTSGSPLLANQFAYHS